MIKKQVFIILERAFSIIKCQTWEGIEKTNKENAKKMLELKMDLETISNVTGLTKEQINDLK